MLVFLFEFKETEGHVCSMASVPLKYRCPIKKSNHVRPTYLGSMR